MAAGKRPLMATFDPKTAIKLRTLRGLRTTVRSRVYLSLLSYRGDRTTEMPQTAARFCRPRYGRVQRQKLLLLPDHSCSMSVISWAYTFVFSLAAAQTIRWSRTLSRTSISSSHRSLSVARRLASHRLVRIASALLYHRLHAFQMLFELSGLARVSAALSFFHESNAATFHAIQVVQKLLFRRQ